MKIYFYGSNEEEARKNSSIFFDELFRLVPFQKVNFISMFMCVFKSPSSETVPKGYRYQYLCEYEVME